MLVEHLSERYPLVAEPEDSPGRAGVALLFSPRREGAFDLLLTRRARHLNSHPGQVAFPGGKWEPGDRSLLETTRRELEEEICARPGQYQLFGSLPEYRSRAGIRVLPYLGIADDIAGFEPGDGEIESLFWVPLEFFVETQPVRVDHFDRAGLRTAPAWMYGDYEIWGMTARILADLLASLESSGAARDRSREVMPRGARNSNG